jgi:hypothetical protein
VDDVTHLVQNEGGHVREPFHGALHVRLLLGVGKIGLNLGSGDTHKALDASVQSHKGAILSAGFAHHKVRRQCLAVIHIGRGLGFSKRDQSLGEIVRK